MTEHVANLEAALRRIAANYEAREGGLLFVSELARKALEGMPMAAPTCQICNGLRAVTVAADTCRPERSVACPSCVGAGGTMTFLATPAAPTDHAAEVRVSKSDG